ncbi:hypothetical protein Anapl_15798 [Anas platyrhynchos]|uniref:Uncharacterized protein n=1 Tax=Anas platyrhynchos TaxID=8839 RepID=R0LEL0_ANAPL|nr:hypothetical protein Anapl_15798 [Anas platyrhynchos]
MHIDSAPKSYNSNVETHWLKVGGGFGGELLLMIKAEESSQACTSALIVVKRTSDFCPAAACCVSEVIHVKAGFQREKLQCLEAAKLLACKKVMAAQVEDVYGKSASKAHILVITLAGEGPQRGPEWVDAPLIHQLGLEDLSSTGLAL